MAGYITANLYLVIEYTNNSNNLECTKENFDSINDKNNLGKELISKISSLGYTTKQLGYGLKPIGIYMPEADISKTTKYYFGISSVWVSDGLLYFTGNYSTQQYSFETSLSSITEIILDNKNEVIKTNINYWNPMNAD